MFPNLLFDVDNTLFNYSKSYRIAIQLLFNHISTEHSIDTTIIEETFNTIKTKYQHISGPTASSHNKYIQIKHLLDKLNIPISKLEPYYTLFNHTFDTNLELYDGVSDFLELCKRSDITLYILTNNICKDQIERLQQLDILHYFTKVYTSEEFGIEKPDIKLYYSVLGDIGCSIHEIAKIGDSYMNDINATHLINMYSFWFENRFEIGKHYTIFNDYKELISLFTQYFNKVEEFTILSTCVGERFDLVQAGGGNTSFKMDNYLFIKSSGCQLSDISKFKNYVGLDCNHILNHIHTIKDIDKVVREKKAEQIVQDAITFNTIYKPSIETTMHSLTKRYTVHIHPIQFNSISGLPNCIDILKTLFTNFCCIEYTTPGIDVALELIKKYNNESLIFMKNHGIVVTCDVYSELKPLIDNTVQILEKYNKVDYKKYHYVNTISQLCSHIKNKKVSYLCEDIVIHNYINSNHFNIHWFNPHVPDTIVYCGVHIVDLDVSNKIDDHDQLFIKNIDGMKYLYISSIHLKKCREIESVLKAHILCYHPNNESMSSPEIEYLQNWNAEKYRCSKS